MRVEVISRDEHGEPDGWIIHESDEERDERIRRGAEAGRLHLTPGQIATLRRAQR